MGLPTGVELKSPEPAVKADEAVVANTVEQQKPVVPPVETITAAAGAANAESTEAVEVCVSATSFWVVSCTAQCLILPTISFLSDCSPAGTNPH